MQFMKKWLLISLSMLLLFASIPLHTEASSSFETDLVNGLTTKSEKITFDVWLKDANGQKINPTEITVTNNKKPVPVNWDDTEKTSYTLSLDIGQNDLTIEHATSQWHYTIHRLEAADGEVIGHFTFSLDAFTLGLGYLIEPTLVPITKGRTAAEELDAILKSNGFTYKSTGNLKSGFYLATIYKDNLYNKPIHIPEPLKQALGDVYDEQDFSPATGLGEFDFNYMSGWMYAVNNTFPNVGFSDKYLLDGDVMRVQFTLAYGQDIGGGSAMGNGDEHNFFPKVNRDALTQKIAEINSAGKEAFLSDEAQSTAYTHAIKALEQIDITQSELDFALAQLQAPDSQPNEQQVAQQLVAQIQALLAAEPLTLDALDEVQAIRTAYNALSSEQQSSVTNYKAFTELEQKMAQLQQGTVTKPYQSVINLIDALPAKEALQLTNEQAVQAAKAAYDALSAEQQQFVTNHTKLETLVTALSNLKNAQQVITLISALPAEASITLANETTIQSVRATYNALTADQQLLVTNYAKLSAAIAKIAQLKSQQTDSAAASKVISLINSIPNANLLTLTNRVHVNYVHDEYRLLTLKQQALVTNYTKLIEAETRLTNLETDITVIVSEINSLPATDQLTIHYQELVASIRAAYNQLTSVQKMAVNNYNTLVEAEIKLATLKEPITEEQQLIPSHFVEAVQKSSGIHAIQENKNELLITAADAMNKLSLTLAQPLLEQIRNSTITSVTIGTTDGLSIAIPYQLFEQTLGTNSSLQLELAKTTLGRKDMLVLQLTEILSNDIERPLLLTNEYIEMTFPLANLVKGEQFEQAVFVRLGDGEFTALPHSIKEGQATLYANRGGQFVYVNEEAKSFQDLDGIGALQQDVEFLATRYIVNGTSANHFSPHAPITRAQFGVMIARAFNLVAANENAFSDTDGQWFEQDIQALYEAGITNAQGSFKPHDVLTREEAAAFMYRALQYIQKDTFYSTNKTHFADRAHIAPYFIEAVATLQFFGIMEGDGANHFNPKAPLTRAQMAKILRRTLEEANMM